jgi:hypothetical protein
MLLAWNTFAELHNTVSGAGVCVMTLPFFNEAQKPYLMTG